MRNGFSFLLIFSWLILSCGGNEQKEKSAPEKTQEETEKPKAKSEFSQALFKDNKDILNTICTTSPLEFIDLYHRVRSISDDAHEKIILADSLMNRGYEKKDWGRGIFDDGPRIVSITLQKENCKIRVDKLYYSTDTVGTFRVTERVKIIE